VAFLVLGPKKLPDLARSLGKGLRDLRRASEDLRSSIQEPLDEIRKPPEEIRADPTETVYQVQDEIEREASRDELPTGEAAKELEDRRQEVEELYAQAAREDAASEEEGPPAALPELAQTSSETEETPRPAEAAADKPLAG